VVDKKAQKDNKRQRSSEEMGRRAKYNSEDRMAMGLNVSWTSHASGYPNLRENMNVGMV